MTLAEYALDRLGADLAYPRGVVSCFSGEFVRAARHDLNRGIRRNFRQSHAAVYFASDGADFVNGTVVDVDGGRTGVAVIAS